MADQPIPMTNGSSSGRYLLGVDVGVRITGLETFRHLLTSQGTFTDVFVLTPTGETVRAKTPSTVQNQSIGVKEGIDKVRAQLKAKYNWDGQFSFVHHGTTVGMLASYTVSPTLTE